MKRWFIALVFVITLAAPWVRVQAQSALEVERLQIDIWPEYDKPSVLMIYRMTIAASSTLPAQVSLRIPKASGAPFNVAMKDVDGMLYNLKYDQVADGEWLRVTFTAAAPEIQFEYYDPGLTVNGAARQFEFRWPGDYKVRTMLVRMQQPINATDMLLAKGAQTMDTGQRLDDGLTYYTVPIDGTIEAGTTFKLQFSYNKPDSILTSTQVQSQPVRTPTNGSLLPANISSDNNVLYIGLGFGALLIVVGVWYLNQQRLATANGVSSGRRRHAGSAAAAVSPSRIRRETAAAAAGESIYCHQCGKRAGPGDAFCRACGSRLRLE
jgi:hypothetical protein